MGVHAMNLNENHTYGGSERTHRIVQEVQPTHSTQLPAHSTQVFFAAQLFAFLAVQVAAWLECQLPS